MNSSTASALLAPTPVHEPIAPLLQTDLQGRTVARFGPFALESHFQPILSLAHGRTVGYEALLRGRTDTGLAISPRQILGHPRTFADRLLLDRLALNTHARNFLALDQRQHWLFLNVQEDVFLEGPREGAAVRELLESGVIPAHHIVLEVLERAVSDEVALQDAVDYYRRLGCLIALDDFGAGQS
ncbi:MAG: EAL domain-containing protein, partial [Burkholderiales bacterium]|nr:EAL domain-containing protein [Burkholderiales bacterium]